MFVNKVNANVTVNIKESATDSSESDGVIYFVDEGTGEGPPRKETVSTDVILQPFAVAIALFHGD